MYEKVSAPNDHSNQLSPSVTPFIPIQDEINSGWLYDESPSNLEHMETQNYSFVHNSSETHESWYESESDSDSKFSQPQTSTSSLQQDLKESCTLMIRSNEYSTIYPLLNLHLNGIRISVSIDTMSGKSYITKRLVKQLRLPIENRWAPLHVKGFGGKNDIVNT